MLDLYFHLTILYATENVAFAFVFDSDRHQTMTDTCEVSAPKRGKRLGWYNYSQNQSGQIYAQINKESVGTYPEMLWSYDSLQICVVLSVVFIAFVAMTKYVLSKESPFRNNSPFAQISQMLFSWLENREKRSIRGIVVMTTTIVTFPVCICVVPLVDLIYLVVPTVLRTFLYGLVTAVGQSAVYWRFLWVFEKCTPSFLRHVAVEAYVIIRSNGNLSRTLFYTIWNWFFGRKKSTDSDPQLEYYKPRGLRNIGNTCYFNSVMQALCNTHVLHSELRNANQYEKLTLSLRNLMEEMRNKGTGAFVPTKVHNDFVKKVSRFDNCGQHDSHECLRHFLDEIRKEQRNAKAGNLLTTVDKIFGGHTATVYICKECDRHYHLFEPCLDISLPVFFETEMEHMKSESQASSTGQLINSEDADDDKCTSSTDEQNSANCDGSKGSEIESINQGEGSKAHAYDYKENNYKCSVQKLTKLLASQSSNDVCADSMKKKVSNVSSYSKTAITLDYCFRHLARVEQIKDEYLCEDCLKKAMANGEEDEDNLKLTSATKQTLIFNPPAILTIHFKRFELLPGRARKRSDMVEYPEYLDIAPFCSSQCLRNDPPRTNIWYSLYAVVVHSGSLEFGHYWAYVKVREREENVMRLSRFLQHKYFNHNVTSDELIGMMNEKKGEKSEGCKQPQREEQESKWYLMNDSSVYEVSVDEVLRQEAYLLFYERVDTEAANITANAQNAADFTANTFDC